MINPLILIKRYFATTWRGSFSNAMKSLRKTGLDSYIVSSFYLNKPIIGICLGMQLLSEGSSEFGFNNGLGLIPGTFEALNNGIFNIGWNAIDVIRPSSLISNANGKAMYFNHSYHYCGPREYVEAECHLENISLPVAAAIHRGNLWGLQFHPEKSQSSGLEVFKKLVHNLA